MKKKNNWFKKIMIVLIIIFLGLYIASVSGYYEAQVSNKVALTDEAIRDFERDVLEGKTVDINTYIQNEDVDYSNKFTKTGENVAQAIIDIITKCFSGCWDAIKVLFF